MASKLIHALGLGRIRPTGRIGGGRGNGRVAMTCGDERELVPTRDRNDRAHEIKDDAGFYLPGADVTSARARRYHPSQMTQGGVAWDSVFDETAARERRLDLEPVKRASAVEEAAAKLGASFRDYTRQRLST